MKKIIQLLGLLAATVLLWACPDTAEQNDTEETKGNTEYVINESENPESAPKFNDNIFVIRFRKGLTESEKDSVRKNFPIQDSVKKCSCGNKDLELWEFDLEEDSAEIEKAKSALRDDGGERHVEGDPFFEFRLPEIKDFKPERVNDSVIRTLVATTSNKSFIDIAVVDTGMDFKNYRTPDTSLYPTSGIFSDCEQISGWNFVNNDRNVWDLNGHGTFVNNVIINELNKNQIPHRVLPVKAFGKNGQGSYWNIICAFGYLLEIQKKTGDIRFINASFGHTVDKIINGKYEGLSEGNWLLKDLIEEFDKNTLVVTSAGNKGNNNDNPSDHHYPSGYDSDNILGVGGFVIEGDEQLSKAGNYGNVSIDLAAPYDDYIFSLVDKEGKPFVIGPSKGSSYATAMTTGRLARLMASDKQKYMNTVDLGAQMLKSDFLNKTNDWVQENPNLNSFIKNGLYQKR